MNASPTIALLIPAYNAAPYLPRLLLSAMRQTEPFDEIWVYDDCSTDDTADIARRFGASVVQGNVNRGCSYGKNTLAALTSTEWLHFHDADDELLPNFVALARQWAREGKFDIVLFPYEERDDETGALIGYRRFDPADVARDARSFAIREQINPFCGLYRRKEYLRVGGYDEDPEVLYNEDVAMHLRLAFAGLTFGAATEVTIVNHRRTNSMSASNRLKCLRAQHHVMRKTAQRDGATRYATEISDRLWDVAGCLASHQDWRAADDAASLAVRLAGLSTLPRGTLFREMCSVSPILALRLRELMIRAFKPKNRIGYPSWRWQGLFSNKRRYQ